MQFVFGGLEPDARTWAFPAIEARLEALGYRFIGVCTTDEPVSMRDFAQGDMHDDDLDAIEGGLAHTMPVFWHPEHRIFATLSGWLDDQTVLRLETYFDDGPILTTETRLCRMPRWRTKTETVDGYQLAAHLPEAGSYAFQATDDTDAHHAQHVAAIATVPAQPSADGSFQAFVSGKNRLLDFRTDLSFRPRAIALLYQMAGTFCMVTGTLLWLLLPVGARTLGAGLGVFGLLLVVVARTSPGLLPAPAVQLPPP